MSPTKIESSLSNAHVESEKLLGQFIPLHYHYQMLLDVNRTGGFERAIDYLVAPGNLVVELGGGTGILSFFAARKAKKVWCVEMNPEMAATARRCLAHNKCADKVEVVEADASHFVPPEPVQVVVCEMLHSALLREKQAQVIDSFKRNYITRFPRDPLPTFIPEASILAVQLVYQDFSFHGYEAAIPMFFQPEGSDTKTTALSDPVVYALFEYRKPFEFQHSFNKIFPITNAGPINAVRFITKNVLAIVPESKSTIDWHNFYMVLPIPDPISVKPGEHVRVQFDYQSGDSLMGLTNTLRVLRE